MRTTDARLRRLEERMSAREPWDVFVVLPEDLHSLYETDAERQYAREILSGERTRKPGERVYGIPHEVSV